MMGNKVVLPKLEKGLLPSNKFFYQRISRLQSKCSFTGSCTSVAGINCTRTIVISQNLIYLPAHYRIFHLADGPYRASFVPAPNPLHFERTRMGVPKGATLLMQQTFIYVYASTHDHKNDHARFSRSLSFKYSNIGLDWALD
jgi:hypothetical protein